MEGSMATVLRRKNTHGAAVYRAQIRRKGQRTLSATFATRKDAEDWAVKTEAAIVEKRYFPERETYTLHEAIERYTREILPHTKPGTAEKKRQVLRWWDKQLGAAVLREISASKILEVRSTMGLAPSTTNAYVSHLSSVLTACVQQWDWLYQSPAFRVKRLPEPKGRARFLDDTERECLLQACKQSRSPHLFVTVMLALATGARYRELLRLRWADIDFVRETVTFWKTKNSDTRVVPLVKHAWQMLQEHKRKWGQAEFVFPSAFGSKVKISLPTNTLWRSWNLARKRAGLKDFRFHDLRHTFASYLAMNGASLLDIGELLGHRQLEMTKRYAHLTDGHKRSVVHRMARKVFKGISI
jgi:integrase